MADKDQLRLEAAADLALKGRLDETERALIEAWNATFRTVRQELEDSFLAVLSGRENGYVSRTVLLRDERLKAAYSALIVALEGLTRDSVNLAGTYVEAVITDAARYHQRIIQAGLGGTLRAGLRSSVIAADPRQIEQIIRRTREQITAKHYELAEVAQQAFRREITRGITVGANPLEAASRSVRGIEDQWNGGLNRARVIARTEMIDAHRRAAQQVHDENADVLSGWEWVAHLGDDRTCRACLSQHGEVFPLSEPGPLGHPQCRCARVPKTKSWEELGFTGMREATSKTPDADEWFEKQPENVQREILTDAGFEAWKAGKWPRSEWAYRKKTKGWRDSYQAAKPPRI